MRLWNIGFESSTLIFRKPAIASLGLEQLCKPKVVLRENR